MFNVWPLFAKQPTGDALETIHQGGNGGLGRIHNQQMNVIVFTIHFIQRSSKVSTNTCKYHPEPINCITIKNMLSVLCHKYQMNVNIENAMSTMSNFVVISHRPSIIQPMKRLQAYKFQLKTNQTEAGNLRRIAGSCRYIWNKALALQQERRGRDEKKLGYSDLCKSLIEWKTSEATFLCETPSQPQQQVLKDLERAYTNFFQKRADFPVFKKRGRHDSFRYPQGFKIDQANSRVFLPKLGWIKYRNSRIIEGIPKNITVSLNAGHWYISIQTEREIETPIHPSSSIVGIDAGITKLATLSDGTIFPPINSYRKHQAKLAKYQRRMSKKFEFSSNWKKIKTKIQRIHSTIANCRKDYLHKTTTTICQNHAIVVIEDLQVSNMSKSAKGTADKHGRNVKAKSGLNKSILDQGWFEFRRQLEYKQQWLGGTVITVPAPNTSRKCNECGHTSADNRQSQAIFKCIKCGHEANADINAARNILRAGHARIACGEIVLSDFSMNQEPAEAIQAYA
jgi:putative transposase